MEEVRAMSSKSLMIVAAGALVALAACTQEPSKDTEEKAVRDQTAKLSSLIASRDAAGIADLYAEDGVFMPPNSPEVKGKDDLTRAWQAMLETPGFSYQLSSDAVVVASSGDLATDKGHYAYSASGGGSAVSDKGKSVLNWVKRNGEWKILAQAYSSDAPIMPPTPTVPADALTPTAPPTATTPDATTPPATAPATPGGPTTTPPATTPSGTTPGTPTTPPAAPPATPTNP